MELCMRLLMKLCMRVCRKLPSFAGRWTSRRRDFEALRRPYLCRGRSPWSWCASGTISVFRALTGTCYGCQWASPSLRGTAAGIWRERSCLLGEWNLHLGEFDFLWCGFCLWSLIFCLFGDIFCDTSSEISLVYQGECQEWLIYRSSWIIMSLIHLIGIANYLHGLYFS
jgi:hypothetical protein